MFLSINWLRDYLVKADAKIIPEELADRMTMRGLAVAGIKKVAGGLNDVLVGKIVKIEPHPNADRLQVTQVVFSDKPDAETKQIVCGAKNIAEGDIVPVALPGAVLPGDFKIKVSAIRGVESHGMICSGKELGVSDESEGILQLPKHSKLGELVARLLGAGQEDTVLEFELTPNRGDCLSVMGLAREIAPLLKTKTREPKPARFRISPHRTSSIIKVEVTDPVACPRYIARVIDNLKVAESPDWIQQRLQAVGLRPINNIVDITNFVMLEYGQPMHAFDLRRIKSGSLTIAPCKVPQDFTLLSGETVKLEEGDILIMDGDTPVALAGIMGGANSQIQPDTTAIVLETATFDPGQVRRTAKRLGIHSDSSKRFEKGVDIATVMIASERAAALLRDGFNAEVYHPPIDTAPDVPKENILALDMREVRRVIGLPDISTDTAAELLETIGISSHKRSLNILQVRIPGFRRDLNDTIDLVEEVARLNGYDSIPLKYPASPAAYDQIPEASLDFEMRSKGVMQDLGFRETIHYSFTSAEIFRKYGIPMQDTVELTNPISEDMKVMRQSLLPSLVETYLYNKNRKILAQKLFELARVYYKDEKCDTGVREVPYLAGILAGGITVPSWNNEPGPVSFYHAKGVVETLVRKLTTVFLAFEPLTNHSLFHPHRSATVKLGMKEVGRVGELHPFLRSSLVGSDDPIVLFELDLDALKKYERGVIRYKVPSKFPAVEMDLAVVVDKNVAGGGLVDSIKHSAGNLLADASVFDVYEGTNIPEGKKSLAFHLSFLSNERTLKDEEVNQLKEKIVQTLTEKHGAQLRA